MTRAGWCVALVAMMALSAGPASAAEWVGDITDSMCTDKHEGPEFQPPPSAKQCTTDCVRGGSTFVLVVGGLRGKVMKIANQDVAGLAALAGEKVKVTGDAKDDIITITKIEKAN